ncbi:MAG: 4'-phosphopantetheinyl transferase superfamily protein [bacterium]|nr:4'-phosphopantetheinyl transferase superfamily protein [bacterium]
MDDIALHSAFEPRSPRDAGVGPAAGVGGLPANELHVWAVPLAGDPEPFLAPLSAAERERASKFHFADHRRRYEITHGALRHVLAAYTGTAPAELQFRVGPRGKPYLDGSAAGAGPFFSLSHSGKLTLIGIATSELGVDCEKLRHLESFREIARKHFSEQEFTRLEALTETARLLAFYRCWTRKEAYIKALGEGLTMGLDTFDVSIDEEPRLLACRGVGESAEGWAMLDVSPGPDFVAAIAIRAAERAVRRFQLTLDA